MHTINIGIPGHDFFGPAWESEPLTQKLNQAYGNETQIGFTLPFPDQDISHIAQDINQVVIGQCSANKASTYWKHVEKLDATKENFSTQIFTAIHQKAVADERTYLMDQKFNERSAFHNAGIATLPSHRNQGIAKSLISKQIQLLREKGATVIFCETTNKISANIINEMKFQKIVEYSYSSLASELQCAPLKEIDDSFTVWCLKL